jgi:hypothetical protein
VATKSGSLTCPCDIYFILLNVGIWIVSPVNLFEQIVIVYDTGKKKRIIINVHMIISPHERGVHNSDRTQFPCYSAKHASKNLENILIFCSRLKVGSMKIDATLSFPNVSRLSRRE